MVLVVKKFLRMPNMYLVIFYLILSMKGVFASTKEEALIQTLDQIIQSQEGLIKSLVNKHDIQNAYNQYKQVWSTLRKDNPQISFSTEQVTEEKIKSEIRCQSKSDLMKLKSPLASEAERIQEEIIRRTIELHKKHLKNYMKKDEHKQLCKET